VIDRELLADVVARIVFAREAVELGEYGVAASVLRDLEEDLAVALERDRNEATS
jgi:hypothetical protein